MHSYISVFSACDQNEPLFTVSQHIGPTLADSTSYADQTHRSELSRPERISSAEVSLGSVPVCVLGE